MSTAILELVEVIVGSGDYDRFEDPEGALGKCLLAAGMFSDDLQHRSPSDMSAYLWRADVEPNGDVHRATVISRESEMWVVDFTFNQFQLPIWEAADHGTSLWPLILKLDDYEREVTRVFGARVQLPTVDDIKLNLVWEPE